MSTTDKTKGAKPAPKVTVKLTAVVQHNGKQCQPGTVIKCSKQVAGWLKDREKAVDA